MRTILLYLIIITNLFLTNSIVAQNLEVEGKAKISVMDLATASAKQVAREPDGTLSIMKASATYAIGDFVQGGVVFWVSLSGEHCKVVSIYDVSPISWSNVSSGLIGSSAQSEINGAGNTVAIMMQSGNTNSAAQHCADLAYGGYDDWYLPSIDELIQVYLNKDEINKTAVDNGGEKFSDGAGVASNYWSSTEFDADFARRHSFFNGSPLNNIGPKDVNHRVRAVRAF